jgi:hypothetical protein
MDKSEAIRDADQLAGFVTSYPDNRDIQQIIKGFINSGKALKILRF